MNLIALDFGSIIIYSLFAGVFLVAYRLSLFLGRYSERMIIALAQLGMYGVARSLLIALIGYNEQTYQQSRFIVWNQVYIRFALLWGAILAVTGLVWIGRISPLVWVPGLLAILVYRILTLMWLNPARPQILTREPALRNLIQDVNEPLRLTRKPAQPLIRRWDYLDELFAQLV